MRNINRIRFLQADPLVSVGLVQIRKQLLRTVFKRLAIVVRVKKHRPAQIQILFQLRLLIREYQIERLIRERQRRPPRKRAAL